MYIYTFTSLHISLFIYTLKNLPLLSPGILSSSLSLQGSFLLPPFHICTSFFESKKPGSHYLPCIYIFTQFPSLLTYWAATLL